MIQKGRIQLLRLRTKIPPGTIYCESKLRHYLAFYSNNQRFSFLKWRPHFVDTQTMQISNTKIERCWHFIEIIVLDSNRNYFDMKYHVYEFLFLIAPFPWKVHVPRSQELCPSLNWFIYYKQIRKKQKKKIRMRAFSEAESNPTGPIVDGFPRYQSCFWSSLFNTWTNSATFT